MFISIGIYVIHMLSVGIKVPHFYYVMFLPLIYIFTGPETVAPRQCLNFLIIS